MQGNFLPFCSLLPTLKFCGCGFCLSYTNNGRPRLNIPHQRTAPQLLPSLTGPDLKITPTPLLIALCFFMCNRKHGNSLVWPFPFLSLPVKRLARRLKMLPRKNTRCPVT